MRRYTYIYIYVYLSLPINNVEILLTISFEKYIGLAASFIPWRTSFWNNTLQTVIISIIINIRNQFCLILFKIKSNNLVIQSKKPYPSKSLEKCNPHPSTDSMVCKYIFHIVNRMLMILRRNCYHGNGKPITTYTIISNVNKIDESVDVAKCLKIT